MRRILGAACIGIACLVSGCASADRAPEPLAERPASSSSEAAGGARSAATVDRPIAASLAPDASDVVAKVGTKALTKDQLLAPMLEEHGLNFLLQLVQLDLARQLAAQKGVVVTPDDVKQERDLTFKRMLADGQAELREKLDAAIAKGDNAAAEQIKAQLQVDPEAALDAYLAQQYTVTRQYVSKTEFNLVLETNTYLRRVAESLRDLDKLLTDELLRQEFDKRMGAKVVIRHIQADKPATVAEVRRRLDAGEEFALVAQALSTNPTTGPNGGAVPPFTMAATNVPDVLKQAAFDMAVGEVSDTIQADNAFHIIKLENRIAPKVVKFEDQRESLRAALKDQVLQSDVRQLRDQIGKQMLANMKIENPVLREQFERKLNERRVQNQQQLDQQMKRDRALAEDPAAGQPGPQEPGAPAEPGAAAKPRDAAAPAKAPAPAPAAPAAKAKPKATRPAPAAAPAASDPPAEQPSPADNDK